MPESHEILAIFAGQKCQACDGLKPRHMAYCLDCYHQLPLALKRSLWKRFGSGFEEAYAAAASWFREHPYNGAHRVKQQSLFERKTS